MDQFIAASVVGIEVKDFCNAFGLSARTLFYWKLDFLPSGRLKKKPEKPRKPPANKLTVTERKEVITELLRSDWSDLSPREIYYRLLDEENRIVASVSTFYRLARCQNLLSRRSKCSQGLALNREKPVLSAMGSNEIWSWDVSQISSFRRVERYYLYVIMDIWSRFVIGWVLERNEKTDIAIQLWKKALEDQHLTGKDLINHKDNGAIMTSTEMVKFVRDAQMIDSYSRAGVSDDNPFSESLFRTIKYFRDFPEYFNSQEEGQSYFSKYFQDYNFSHRHSGIQFLFPASRHYGDEKSILGQRNLIIEEFAGQNSHRYSTKQKIFQPIMEVRIN